MFVTCLRVEVHVVDTLQDTFLILTEEDVADFLMVDAKETETILLLIRNVKSDVTQVNNNINFTTTLNKVIITLT